METVIKSPVIADAFVSLGSGIPGRSVPLNERQFGIVTGDDFIEGAAVSLQAPTSSIPDDERLVDELDRSDSQAAQGTGQAETGDIYEHFWEKHRESLEALERKAMEDGYARGYSKGESDAYLKYEEVIARFQQLVDAGHDSIATIISNAEELVGAIAFEATCKIVGEQLLDPYRRLQVISEVIKDTLDRDILAVKVSPKDFEQIQLLKRDAREDKIDIGSRLVGLPIQADSSVELGGCLVEIKDGDIDGRIETQFRLFAQSIKDAPGNR